MSLANATLVAHWRLNEGTGNSRADATGNGFTMAEAAACGSTTGKIGDCLDTTGASAVYLQHNSNPAGISVGTGHYAISGWFKLDQLVNSSAILTRYQGTGSNRNFFVIHNTSDDTLAWAVYPDPATETGRAIVKTSITLTTGKWYMFVVWHDPDNDIAGIKIQAEDAGSITTDTVSYSSGGTNVGSVTANIAANGDNTNRMDGKIDSVTVWKTSAGVSAEPTDSNFEYLFANGNGVDYPFSFPDAAPASADGSGKDTLAITAGPFVNL